MALLAVNPPLLLALPILRNDKGIPELISDEKRQQAVSAAIKIMDMAYAPYSRFQVGAAIIDEQGRLHQRSMLKMPPIQMAVVQKQVPSAMIAAGGKQIQYIAVAGRGTELCTPCGACRQQYAVALPHTVIAICDASGSRAEFSALTFCRTVSGLIIWDNVCLIQAINR